MWGTRRFIVQEAEQVSIGDQRAVRYDISWMLSTGPALRNPENVRNVLSTMVSKRYSRGVVCCPSSSLSPPSHAFKISIDVACNPSKIYRTPVPGYTLSRINPPPPPQYAQLKSRTQEDGEGRKGTTDRCFLHSIQAHSNRRKKTEKKEEKREGPWCAQGKQVCVLYILHCFRAIFVTQHVCTVWYMCLPRLSMHALYSMRARLIESHTTWAQTKHKT